MLTPKLRFLTLAIILPAKKEVVSWETCSRIREDLAIPNGAVLSVPAISASIMAISKPYRELCLHCLQPTGFGESYELQLGCSSCGTFGASYTWHLLCSQLAGEQEGQARRVLMQWVYQCLDTTITGEQ